MIGPACTPTCPGLFVNQETGEVERCDECGIFNSDEAAVQAASEILGAVAPYVDQARRSGLEVSDALERVVDVLERNES